MPAIKICFLLLLYYRYLSENFNILCLKHDEKVFSLYKILSSLSFPQTIQENTVRVKLDPYPAPKSSATIVNGKSKTSFMQAFFGNIYGFALGAYVQRQAMGILAQDTDFLIYQTSVPYFSKSHLDISPLRLTIFLLGHLN